MTGGRLLAKATATVMTALAAAGAAQQLHPAAPPLPPAPVGAPLTVWRGSIPGWTPVWVEYSDLGTGRAALTVLDGLDSRSPVPVAVALGSNGRRGSSCEMTGEGTRVAACPTGAGSGFAARVEIAGLAGLVRFASVATPFGHGAAMDGSADLTAVASACRLPGWDGGAFAGGDSAVREIFVLRDAVNATTRTPPGIRAELAGLRRERLSLVDRMTPAPWEAERLAGFDRDIARMIDFRYRAQVLAQRQRFEVEMQGRSERVAARERIAAIDGRLAVLYAADRSDDPRALLAAQLAAPLAALETAATAPLTAPDGLSLTRLVRLARGLREVDACAAQLGRSVAARPALTAAFSRAAADFDRLADAEFAAATGEQRRARIAEIRASDDLSRALAVAGRPTALAGLETRLATDERRRQVQADAAARAQVARTVAATPPQAAWTRPAPVRPPTAAHIAGGAVAAYGGATAIQSSLYATLGIATTTLDYENGRYVMTGPLSNAVTTATITDPRCAPRAPGRYDCRFAMLTVTDSTILGFTMSTRAFAKPVMVRYDLVWDGIRWTIPKLRTDFEDSLRKSAAARAKADADTWNSPDAQRQRNKAFYCPGNGANPFDTQAFC